MAAKLRLALTQNSSPTPLANRQRVAQIAESRGRASGRPPQRAKYPRRARRETPQRPKAPSADGAIPGQGPWSAPPLLRGGRRGPSTNAVPGPIHPRTGANAYHVTRRGQAPALQGGTYQPGRKWNVPASGGTHSSRPTVHIGSPSMFVGRGIPDAPKPHPIRGRQGCRPLRFGCSLVHPGGGGQAPALRGGTYRPAENGTCLPAAGHIGPALQSMSAVRPCS